MRGFSALIGGIAIFVATVAGLQARQGATADGCRTAGRVTGVGTGLPGVAITVRRGETVQTATATGVDGSFAITVPAGSYRVSFELTGFDRVERDVTVAI